MKKNLGALLTAVIAMATLAASSGVAFFKADAAATAITRLVPQVAALEEAMRQLSDIRQDIRELGRKVDDRCK